MRNPLGACAGTPFVILNTLCGALAAYGFAGLRYTASAIILFAVILVLQSLIAIQLLIFCVYATPNQVYPTNLREGKFHAVILQQQPRADLQCRSMAPGIDSSLQSLVLGL